MEDMQDTPEREPAPGDLGLIQEFVNSADLEVGSDELASPDLAATWLRSHELLDGEAIVAEEDRRQLIDAREAIRSLLLANNGAALDPRAVANINRAAEAASVHVNVRPDGSAELGASAPGARGAVGRLLAIVLSAMIQSAAGSNAWSRLKACGDDGCQWAFYDQSKNLSGTWCSMAVCGNRTKTRAYRRRIKANYPGP
jgi:predicted RNA-binding Zn ribbon-like protein